MPSPRLAAFLATLLPLLGASPATAQSSAVIDEGTFMVSRNGAPIGRESFRVVRVPGPGGQVFRATGQSAFGDTRFTTSLATDSAGVPVRYESELSERGGVVQRLEGIGRPGRFSVLVRTKSGEAAREYLLNNGALLIDDEVIHQFYFIPVAAKRDQLIVITPRAGQQARFRVEERQRETVEIAGRGVASRHFVLTQSPGSSREVWTDENGRLLKVVIGDKGITAIRDDLPR